MGTQSWFGSSRTEDAGPPAYFLSLSVENIRCFGPRQTLCLSDPTGRPARWTILLGDNGVGKTTLLECLAQLQPRSRALMSGLDPRYGVKQEPLGWGSWLDYLRDSSFPRRAHQDCLPLNADATMSATVSYGPRLSAAQCKGESCRISLSSGPFPADPSVSSPQVNHDTLRALVCYGYGATRRSGTARISRARPEEACASLFSETAQLRSAEDWFLLAAQRAQLGATADGDVDGDRAVWARNAQYEVSKLMAKLLPEVQRVEVRDLGETVPDYVVTARTPYGTVPMTSLSLGYRTTITWTLDLASRLFDRYPKSRNPLGEPAIALVDEIDLHMHPRWQRSVIEHLTQQFPETQFIVTAHSPLIVQASEDANIAVLRREEDHVVIDQSMEAVRGWRADQILASELFGCVPPRAPKEQALMDERRRLLVKRTLTKREQKRLVQLQEEVGGLPTAETREDIEAMSIIRRAAQELKRREANR